MNIKKSFVILILVYTNGVSTGGKRDKIRGETVNGCEEECVFESVCVSKRV